jgi:hypothetical protein
VPDAKQWSDPAEFTRWQEALTAIADQERQERGVDERAGLRIDDGDLLAHYGPVKFLVATTRRVDDLPDEQDLFERIDTWIVFERPAGPGVVLPRDRPSIDGRLDELTMAEHVWPALITQVMHDVEATTSIRVAWRLERQTEEVMIPFHEESTYVRFGGPPLAKRALLVPELWLRTARLGSFHLSGLETMRPAVMQSVLRR